MSTDLIQSGTTAITNVSPVEEQQELQLVAENADQMMLAQRQMVDWFRAKKSNLEADLEETKQELAIAEQNGWRTNTFKRTIQTLSKRVEFYEKCCQASEAGYVVVPNMPGDVFAVRTARAKPHANVTDVRRGTAAQRSEAPPAGEGQYVDELAYTRVDHVETRKHSHSGGEYDKEFFKAVRFDTEIDFPVSVCKPQVMSATAKAMALKVFDEIAVVDDGTRGPGLSSGGFNSRRGDPLVVGIIRDPRRRGTWNDQRITFLIGWYIDTRTL